MSYKDTYQQAMEKVCADDVWKQQTLAKMQAQQHRKPSLVLWRKAALSAAALAMVVGGVLVHQSQQQKQFSVSLADTPSTMSLEPSDEQVTLENTPRATMQQQAATLPLIQFSKQDIQEVSQKDLPFEINLSNAPKVLPVWQKNQDEWLFLGDYPLISATDAALLVDGNFKMDTEQAPLIYVESKGYLQPVYHFISETTDSSDWYIPAILGEYYE